MSPDEAIRTRVVLIGGGHSHVTVLRSFGMQPEPGVGLTLVAKELDAPYSGMLPGFVAGHYSYDECHIDLVRLAQFAGARVVHGEAVGIDRKARHILVGGRPPIAYDLLSIDTGITPLLDGIDGAAEHALAVKPVSAFAPRWRALEARALGRDGPRRFAVVGIGAAGFELIMAIRHRLREAAPRHDIAANAFTFSLIGSGELLPSHNPRARRLATQALAAGGIELITHETAVAITPTAIRLAGGRSIPADAVLVTTKAAPPAWFAETELPRDALGFLAVRPTLQVLDDDDVFAVGDCSTVIEHVREKAGVFAVRQGPPLAENLRLRAQAEPARPFRPQRNFLTLLALGHKSAIASKGALSAAGPWAWTWKDYIDRRFMDRFNVLPEMRPSEIAGDALRCRGCAAKIGPATLRGALGRLIPPPASNAMRDLSPGDDAALLDMGGNALRLETVDFFPAFWPEPFAFGEIAAVHAMSDIFAKGGQPDHALAIAVLPPSSPKIAEGDLFQLMSGARAAFDREGVALVGGHSSVGNELGAGFFVSGTVPRDRFLRKGGQRPGDRLILTKPLGTGILFAGWMRGKARARDIASAMVEMRRSNAMAGAILRAHGVTAATDVTGFGLGGHLVEMLDASGMGARLEPTRCPIYPGIPRLLRAGIRSSLLPENLALAARIRLPAAASEEALAILLDPQTSGGLLACVPAERAAACLASMKEAGLPAALIGEIVPGIGTSPAVVEVVGETMSCTE